MHAGGQIAECRIDRRIPDGGEADLAGAVGESLHGCVRRSPPCPARRWVTRCGRPSRTAPARFARRPRGRRRARSLCASRAVSAGFGRGHRDRIAIAQGPDGLDGDQFRVSGAHADAEKAMGGWGTGRSGSLGLLATLQPRVRSQDARGRSTGSSPWSTRLHPENHRCGTASGSHRLRMAPRDRPVMVGSPSIALASSRLSPGTGYAVARASYRDGSEPPPSERRDPHHVHVLRPAGRR